MATVNKWEDGWKVVHKDDKSGKMYSAIASNLVEYRFNEITRPRKGCGPLAVYKTRRQARQFIFGNMVVRCQYIPSKHTCIWNRRPGHRELSTLPDGTVLADAVRLVRKGK